MSTNGPQFTGGAGHSKTWTRTCRVIFIGLSALLVAAVTYHLVSSKQGDRQTREQIPEARAQGIAKNDAVMAQRVEMMQKMGLGGPLAAMSQVDTCKVEQHSGFLKTDYNQSCRVVSIRGYRLETSVERAQELVFRAKLPSPWLDYSVGCELLTRDDVPSGEGALYDITRVSVVNPAVRVSDPTNNCVVPTRPQSDRDNQLLYVSGDAWDDRDSTVMWITVINEYWDEDLGCEWSALCTQPRRAPIMVEPPAGPKAGTEVPVLK